MTTFQILTLVLAGLGLLGSIVAIYLKLSTDIVKLQLQITEIRKELLQKDISFLIAEKNNREDHRSISDKLDRLIEKLL